MKVIKLPLIAVLCTGIFSLAFMGCKKEAQSPSLTSDAKGGNTAPAINSQPVIAPYTAISFNPTPGQVGETFTATVSLDPVVDCGALTLEQAQYDSDSPVGAYATGDPAPKDSVGTVASWVRVASVELPGTLPLSYSYVPAKAGNVGFRAHYMPKAGGECGYNGNPQVAVNATINAGCVEGLSAERTSAQSMGTDSKGKTIWQFTVVMHLNTCENNYLGKLQGGLIANATLVSASPEGYAAVTRNKNTVVTWSNVGTGNYTLVYTVPLAAGTDIPITGPWSFKWDGGEYPYTDRVIFTF
jgi:hypothetical protein